MRVQCREELTVVGGSAVGGRILFASFLTCEEKQNWQKTSGEVLNSFLLSSWQD